MAGIPGLLDDLEGDTANVLLTLARIWLTLATGEIRPKDVAADWALERLSARYRPPLSRARAVYLGDAPDAWQDVWPEARATADSLVATIQGISDRRV
jgi:streptomycin 3"-adenylyltransferase